MIRLTIFVIALLLAVGAIEPTGAWLVTLAVLAGIECLRIGPFRPSRPWRWIGWSGRRRWREEFDW